MDKKNLTKEDMGHLGKLLLDVDDEDEAKNKEGTALATADQCELKRALAKLGRVGLLDMEEEQREVAVERICLAFA